MELETPYIRVDSDRLERNIRKMADVAACAGVKLRPHVKTHKIPAIALQQIRAGAAGITVAKLSEAEVMAEHGVKDIFLALPVVSPSKLRRLVRLAEQVRLVVGVDSAEGARLLAAAARGAGLERVRKIEVRLEVDTGMRRTGVRYEQALELARRVADMPDIRLSGLYTYRGAMVGGRPTLDLRQAGVDEGRQMVELAERIRAAGIPLEDVSVGSTPTAAYAASVPGVTEIRPGTYVFQDRMQARYGVCGPEDWAASICVTVISRPAEDLAVIDGGSKTFATDIQPGTEPLQLAGYGHVLGLEGVQFERLSEEHGMLRLDPAAAESAKLRIGQRLHIVPNHICSTINLHNQVILFAPDGSYEKLPVLARGMLQ
ncbi:alanine racemase [Paenibacillus koleovorans]|uniref:alanine racemase n=1 Tax=Paenibacillus koleovorans TaxID=121608 RepID=UPI001FE9220A|nr:alanine racemase [Paenibacillus koleovorans]